MQQEMERFLNLQMPPARLTAEQAAWFLGFVAHEIPILIARGLLRPLGHPAHNGQKYFLTATLEELRRDEKWFVKATDAVGEYWRCKNARKGQNGAGSGNHRLSQESAGRRELAEAGKGE
jgi:hypothetical protein